VGAAGIINIERESHLSGSSFDKAILILEGYMRNKYASKHPLSLSASLAMEQSYGLIEGDSATVAELVCLLSAFAGIPLRQDIAITGSVNQWGQIQAVGGVTQKVEGFYEVCKQIGLTGNQGVCIPRSNVRHLVLRH
jgi:predicted ATP-dependent protease